jgi:hypothetical protein
MINFAHHDTAALRQAMTGAYDRAVRKHLEIYCLIAALITLVAIAVIH